VKRREYARASTVGETLEAQLEQLEAAGCTSIYNDKISGVQTIGKELGPTAEGDAKGRCPARYSDRTGWHARSSSYPRSSKWLSMVAGGFCRW